MRARGFSLLEVLVAFSILALSLGVLMQIFSGSLNNASISKDQTEATVIAQSLLASAGVDSVLEVGQTTGHLGERFRWKLLMELIEESSQGGATGKRGPELWKISAEVAWGGVNGDKARAVSLTTLRVQVRKQ